MAEGYIKFEDGYEHPVNLDSVKSKAEALGHSFEDEVRRGLDIYAREHGKPLEVNIPGFDYTGSQKVAPTLLNPAGVITGQPVVSMGNPVDVPTFRGGADFAFEGLGAMAGEAATLPLAPLKALRAPKTVQRGANLAKKVYNLARSGPSRAGAGAVGGTRLGDAYQRAHGVEPEPKSALGTFAINAAGETLFRLPWMARRLKQKVYTAGANLPKAQEQYHFLRDVLGVHEPNLKHVLESTGGGSAFWKSLANWGERNPLGAERLHTNALNTVESIRNRWEDLWVVPRGNRMMTPDVVMAGKAYETGVKKYEKGWREVGNALYGRFFTKLDEVAPKGAPVVWDATERFLKDRASLDPILETITPNKLKNLHRAMNDVYTEVITPDGLQHVAGGYLPVVKETRQQVPMPFQKMKELRTRVGELIGQFEPNADLPKKELKGLYDALSEDMETAAKNYGLEAEYKRANQHWTNSLKMHEETLDRISAKASREDMGKAVQSLVISGDYQNLGRIKGLFKPNSEEWAMIQNYAVRELGTATDGNFDFGVLARKWGKLGENSKRVLAGTGNVRKSLDNFMQAYGTWGKELTKTGSRQYSRWSRGEFVGPFALVTGVGYGAGAAAHENKFAGIPYAITTGALMVMAPTQVAKLLVDPEWTKWAAKTLDVKSPELFAGALSRLGTQYSTASPDEQAAVMQFIHNVAMFTPDGGDRKQAQPNQIGAMASPRSNLGPIGGR